MVEFAYLIIGTWLVCVIISWTYKALRWLKGTCFAKKPERRFCETCGMGLVAEEVEGYCDWCVARTHSVPQEKYWSA
jgi:hypothetical protein